MMNVGGAKEVSAARVGQLFTEYRPLLFSIAYRMLGTVADAEDIVQETFAAMQAAQLERISNIKSYLCKMVMNRCLNECKSARRRREEYVGPWLPEPLIAEQDLPAAAAENNEALSYAFLVMLDRLSPLERAVFVLRTAYEYDYADIGEMVGRTEVYTRKLYSNARKKLQPEAAVRGEEHVPVSRRQRLERFVAAFQRRDVEGLMRMLNEDAVLVSDGGGKVRSAMKPIYSRDRVTTLLEVIARGNLAGAEAQIRQVNGREELLFYKEGRLKSVFCFAWGEKIDTIYAVFNPEKLKEAQPES
ncbi:RNA polymerase sigma-70 factor [Paenibacillus sp. GD4]|uniref:RNA polymerase sigma-70 factor n=1 Tax=Paenibacillus sp. GD4 TaxID=3068890 RepID=UPI0027966044|nr:RNA polymerase sigma-70 factor [Paenibacillus sp. GD4]MDQ1911430.1 RNA polymerase sigma-70 factor [Paenibacillus sp. GD4]